MPVFLQTIISIDGFTENFMAYVVDMVSRSSCQVMDIFSLDAKLDAITRQIQQAYMKCDLLKVLALQKKYIETNGLVNF